MKRFIAHSSTEEMYCSVLAAVDTVLNTKYIAVCWLLLTLS